jgi:type IV pilus assembly protein PilB
MAEQRVRLGELLLEARIITRQQLEEVLALQKRDGRRIGTLLIESGLVSETQVTQILSQQLSLPWVSLYHIDFSRQLLNLVPRDIAEKYCLVPIFVRRVRGYGDTLYVAMDDPGDEAAIREVGAFSELPVRTMIAPPSDIRAAIRAYYGGRQELPSLADALAETDRADRERARSHEAAFAAETAPATPPPAEVPSEASGDLSPDAEQQLEAPARDALEAQAPADAPAPAMDADANELERITVPPDSGPQIEAREVTMPAPRRGKGPRMVTLTLLDGTQVRLPARGRAQDRQAADDEQLTARDLIAALRAVAHGADATEILGKEARWEAMFAALLSVLIKKHLVADWEFIDEYKNI